VFAVNKDDTDMVPALTEVAAGSPGALFFPIFQPAADFIADQAPSVAGLADTVLVTADSLLNTNYLSLPQTAGIYFTGPDQRLGANVNQSTGRSAAGFLEEYRSRYGESPSSPFWVFGYDAASAARRHHRSLHNQQRRRAGDRPPGVRDHLDGVRGYRGLVGTLGCDDFGDCGAARLTVIQNLGGQEHRSQHGQHRVHLHAVAARTLPRLS